MTNEELIAKIREEIERLIEESDFDESENLYSLLSFLSTLEEQTKEVSNPIFDECVANVDQKVREEVRRNIDIEDELVRYFGRMPEDDEDKIELARHFAQWGAEHTPLPEDTVLFNKGVAEGRRLERDEFEKNRLAACSNQTEEEYDRETDFAIGIIKKEHRQPTFSDAINYGMRLQKEQDERIYREFFNERNQGNASFQDLLAYKEGHSDGMEEQKEQMMKEARNHFVYNILSGNDMKKMIEIYNDEADCKPGDVVRVIIFKKEDEK